MRAVRVGRADVQWSEEKTAPCTISRLTRANEIEKVKMTRARTPRTRPLHLWRGDGYPRAVHLTLQVYNDGRSARSA